MINIEDKIIIILDSLKEKKHLKKLCKNIIYIFERYLNEIYVNNNNKANYHEINNNKINYKEIFKNLKCKLMNLLINDIAFKNWKIYLAKTPKQNNNDDCGVFLCKFIEYIYLMKSFDFSQDDLKYFRYQIAEKLIK
jgi:Ulp1 family protease